MSRPGLRPATGSTQAVDLIDEAGSLVQLRLEAELEEVPGVGLGGSKDELTLSPGGCPKAPEKNIDLGSPLQNGLALKGNLGLQQPVWGDRKP